MTNTASLLNCTYNVHLASGMVWMTGREAIARLGWEDFHSDYVEHSEWCKANHGAPAEVRDFWADPFGTDLDTSEPPF